MLQYNKHGVPRILYEIIESQLKAVHQMAIEPTSDASCNPDYTNGLIHTLVDPALCMHCFNVHDYNAACQPIPTKIAERLKIHRKFETLMVVFPFRKPLTDSSLTEEQKHFGRFYVRVMSLGYFNKVLHSSTSDWQYLQTKIGDETVTSRMIHMKRETAGHFTFRVKTSFEKPGLLTGAKARPVYSLSDLPDTHTMTASRGHFWKAMRMQLTAIHKRFSLQPLQPDLILSLQEAIYNPDICMLCGSFHNNQDTPCMTNMLMLQGKAAPSRVIHVNYQTNLKGWKGTKTVALRILDGGNFKREVFSTGHRDHWSIWTYRSRRNKLIWSTMTLVAPDCFVIRDAMATESNFEPYNVKAHQEFWISKWYDDTTDLDRNRYLPLVLPEADPLPQVQKELLQYTQHPQDVDLSTPKDIDPHYLTDTPLVEWNVDRFPEFWDDLSMISATDSAWFTIIGENPKGPVLMY